MNLFIDTNVWLSFYHLSSDDLEELRKLAVLIQQGRVRLLLPQQVVDEFRRNRESKIADALKRFREDKMTGQFPQICKEYDEYDELRDALTTYDQAKSRLLEKLVADVNAKRLKADIVIDELFQRAETLPITPAVRSRARERFDLGNPPGKRGSYGDAINWECLVGSVEDDVDIYFVSDDQDYASATDSEQFSPFLSREWSEQCRGRVVFFKRVSAFFRGHFPDVELAEELEKELLIRDLAQSPSFRDTRKALRELIKFEDFSDSQVNDIVAAAVSNNQIYWIMGDPDIHGYLSMLIGGREDRIDEQSLAEFERLMEEA